MRKILIACILLLCSQTCTYSANLFTTNGIFTKRVDVTFSPELIELIDDVKGWDEWAKVVKQFRKMPKKIAKINPVTSAHYPVGNLRERIGVVKVLKTEQATSGNYRIHVAYQPNESFGLGNSVGRVFATNAGLILLNDIRLKQVAGSPPDAVYLINLILHEMLHIYGLDHAVTFGTYIKNKPVMNLGKFGFVGMNFDDRIGLIEYYGINSRKRKSVTIQCSNGQNVILLNRRKKRFSQGKTLEDGQVIFPQVKRGKYTVLIDLVEKKRIKVKRKDKVVCLD